MSRRLRSLTLPARETVPLLLRSGSPVVSFNPPRNGTSSPGCKPGRGGAPHLPVAGVLPADLEQRLHLDRVERGRVDRRIGSSERNGGQPVVHPRRQRQGVELEQVAAGLGVEQGGDRVLDDRQQPRPRPGPGRRTACRPRRCTGSTRPAACRRASSRSSFETCGGRKNSDAVTPPSTCSSSYHFPSTSTGIVAGGKNPGIDADASSTRRNSAGRPDSVPRLAIAPMSQTTSRRRSRCVVPTYSRRPLACSAATRSTSGLVDVWSISLASGLESANGVGEDGADVRPPVVDVAVGHRGVELPQFGVVLRAEEGEGGDQGPGADAGDDVERRAACRPRSSRPGRRPSTPRRPRRRTGRGR